MGFYFCPMKTEALYSIFKKHPFIATDTRNLKKGSIFFSLKGDQFNGNKFAAAALENGAAYAVIDEAEYKISDQYILVDNVLQSLQNLAAHHRSTLNIPVLGITGSNGKTTTKELMLNVLKKKFRVLATEKNYNNHIGVPLTLLQIDQDIEISIVEMGANHMGEIASLCEIANPSLGIITNIGKAHLEGFGSYENVVKGKTELCDFLRRSHGKIFVNNNNQLLKNHAGNMDMLTYGTNASSDVYITFMLANPYVKVYWENKKTIIESKLIGKYNFENIAAAIAVGDYFGIEQSLIREAIESYIPLNARSQIVKTDHNTVILDAYNANPTSMIAALENFNLMAHPKKVVMLGDMLELGKYAEDEHQKVIDFMSAYNYEKIFLVGNIFQNVCSNRECFTYQSSSELKNYLKQNPFHDALILVKGSHGIKMEYVLDSL